MWSTALDSKTCETCAPLDQSRWEQGDSSRPDWPIHPNCRCEALLIDPEDEFWNETERTVQQIRPVDEGKYKGKGAYKTPIKVKGKKYYRKAVTVTSDRPPTRLADVYASWATSDHNASWWLPWVRHGRDTSTGSSTSSTRTQSRFSIRC